MQESAEVELIILRWANDALNSDGLCQRLYRFIKRRLNAQIGVQLRLAWLVAGVGNLDHWFIGNPSVVHRDPVELPPVSKALEYRHVRATTDAIRTDTGLTMGAMGARGELVPRTAAAGFGLAVTSDVLVVSTTSDAAAGLAATDADVSRLRLGLDGSWLVQFDGGTSITPSFEIGMRRDGGDAETGFGVDIGSGLAFANAQSGFGFELNARGLLAHEDSDFSEWGVSGAFRFDPNPSSELGLSLSVGPSWGASPAGGVSAFLGRETMAGVALDGATPQGGRLGTEAAWGFPAFGGRYTGTPYLGLGLTEVGRDYRFGWRLGAVDIEALQLSLGLEGTRRESDGRPPEHGAMLRSSLRWQGTPPRMPTPAALAIPAPRLGGTPPSKCAILD